MLHRRVVGRKGRPKVNGGAFSETPKAAGIAGAGVGLAHLHRQHGLDGVVLGGEPSRDERDERRPAVRLAMRHSGTQPCGHGNGTVMHSENHRLCIVRFRGLDESYLDEIFFGQNPLQTPTSEPLTPPIWRHICPPFASLPTRSFGRCGMLLDPLPRSPVADTSNAICHPTRISSRPSAAPLRSPRHLAYITPAPAGEGGEDGPQEVEA